MWAHSRFALCSLPGTIHSAAEEIRAAGGKALAVECDIRYEDQVPSLSISFFPTALYLLPVLPLTLVLSLSALRFAFDYRSRKQWKREWLHSVVLTFA